MMVLVMENYRLVRKQHKLFTSIFDQFGVQIWELLLNRLIVVPVVMQ